MKRSPQFAGLLYVLAALAPLALAQDALGMDQVHTCHTTHCMSGWACHALPGGMELENDHDWFSAGFYLLGAEAASHFFESNEDATKFLQRYMPEGQAA